MLLCFHFILILSILFSFFEETLGQDYKFPPFFSSVCPCVRVCTFMCRCAFLYVLVSMCVGQRSKSSVFFSLSTLYFETISHSQSLTIQLDRVTRDPRDPLQHPSTHWGNRCCLLPDFFMWFPGFELTSSYLHGKYFTDRAISPTPNFLPAPCIIVF